MPRAVWKDVVIAESDQVQRVDGYTYFPRASVRWEHLEPSDHTSRCYWKGTARYYSVKVDGEHNADAAWEYPDPSQAAGMIRDHVGFWRGVRIEP
jgi:uncharacterized protein (DUF427 family)